MKILRFEETERTPTYYTFNNVSLNDGVLTFCVGASGYLRQNEGDFIKEVSIDLKEWKGKILDVYIIPTEKGYEIRTIDVMKNCSIGNGMPSMAREGNENTTRIFKCAVRDPVEDTYIHLGWGHEPVEGFENVIIPQEYSHRRLEAFCELDPYAKELVSKFRRKSDMQNKIDFKDSISYLEAQIDVLTRYVLKGATTELTEALTKADEQSVLNIKDLSGVLEEFSNKKAKVRKAQKEYYESSSETVDS